MADLLREELLSLAEAAMSLPNRPHVSTVWRWCRRGIKGVCLQTVIVGGRRYTTVAFLSDFIMRLTEPRPGSPSPASNVRAQQKAQAAQLAAEKF